MEKEIWKPVVGYEGLYEVSNCGDVRSVDRVVGRSDGKQSKLRGQMLRPVTNQFGHFKVSLCKQGKVQRKYVHRTVFEAFCGSIPKGFDVHHVDGNRQNNRVSNLDAIPHTEHISKHMKGKRHGLGYKPTAEAIGKVRMKLSVPVAQYSLDGELIQIFSSMSEAGTETGIDTGRISKCCSGKLHKAGGFRWKKV